MTIRRVYRTAALPLLLLVLWGIQLIAGLGRAPVSVRSRFFGASVPFLSATGVGFDYYQFWIVGRAESALRPDNIYSMPNRQRLADYGHALLQADPNPSERFANSVQFRTTIETFSTPFLYAAVNAFASGDYERDYDRFMGVGLAAVALALAAMGGILGFGALEILLFAAAVWLWCEPLAADLRVGNVNELQLAGLALYLVLRRRPAGLLADLLSGLVLGFLVAFKPTLGVVSLVLALAWIVDRRGRTALGQVAGAAAGAGAAIIVGCRFLHTASAWIQWKDGLADLDRLSNVSVQIGNFSLPRLILETSGGRAREAGPFLLALTLGIVGVVLFLSRGRARAAAASPGGWFERDFWTVAMGAALSVATLKLAWLHYYLLLIPLLLWVLRPVPAGGDPFRSRLRAAPALVLGTLALAAVFGRPLIFLFEPDPAYAPAIYLAGAWGLILLGCARAAPAVTLDKG